MINKYIIKLTKLLNNFSTTTIKNDALISIKITFLSNLKWTEKFVPRISLLDMIL